MRMRVKTLLAVFSPLLLLGSMFGGLVQAEEWPTRPVRVIVGTAPGGSTDVLARILAHQLSAKLGQNFVVDNQPGAGGLIAMEDARGAAPDGYTFLVVGGSQHTILPTLETEFPYDPLADVTHIAGLGGPPTVLIVEPNLSASNLAEFIDLAKAEPLSYGSPSIGTVGHLVAEQFQQLAGTELVHVPYRGAGPAVVGVMGAHVNAAWVTLGSAGEQINAGAVRALAVTSPERVPAFPDIPTFAELGLPELTGLTWFGLSGPPDLPPEIVTKLNEETREAFQLPEVLENLQVQGLIPPDDLDSEAYSAFVAAELARWATIVRDSGLLPAN